MACSTYNDSFADDNSSDKDKKEVLIQIREKRWAVYVAKAAKRFECWWEKCVEPDARKAEWTNESANTDRGPELGESLRFDETNLPPLGDSPLRALEAYQ